VDAETPGTLRPGCDAADLVEDGVWVGVTPRRLLGIDQRAVDDHLEDAALAGDQDQVRDGVLELGQDLGRQTDGTVGVASDRAVFDADPHPDPPLARLDARRAHYASRP